MSFNRAMKAVCTTAILLAILELSVPLVVTSGQSVAQTNVPSIGSQVPSYVLAARTPSQECLTDVKHRDPCASISIAKFLFTVALDAQNKTVTYVATEDPRVMTDGELSVGGSCRLLDQKGKPDQLTEYLGWLIDPKWTDTSGGLSGKAVWYAALMRDSAHPGYGKIVAFVQSKYLSGLKDHFR